MAGVEAFLCYEGQGRKLESIWEWTCKKNMTKGNIGEGIKDKLCLFHNFA